eukprot:Platyproteum_vivax@DN1562_c0_g1_i1.p1
MPDVVSKLISGIGAFSRKRCLNGSSYNTMVRQGQHPKVMIIGCCDSLVDPLLLTDAKEGELFVHRSIAALVPPYEREDRNSYHGTSSALEYAVTRLTVEHIVILGHGCCGGVSALLNDPSLCTCASDRTNSHSSFIKSWMKIACAAREHTLSNSSHLSEVEKQTLCEKECVRISVNNLQTFPWINASLAKGTLKIHGWHFDRGD